MYLIWECPRYIISTKVGWGIFFGENDDTGAERNLLGDR